VGALLALLAALAGPSPCYARGEVCAGRMELQEAQAAIARDWVEAAAAGSTLATVSAQQRKALGDPATPIGVSPNSTLR